MRSLQLHIIYSKFNAFLTDYAILSNIYSNGFDVVVLLSFLVNKSQERVKNIHSVRVSFARGKYPIGFSL